MGQIAEVDAAPAPSPLFTLLYGTKGRGLNSIPVRFALMSAIICSIGFALQYHLMVPGEPKPLEPGDKALIALTVCLPALVTFFAARKLASMIHALRESTQAILDGDVDSPVDVECECEIGGLADSFRAMVARLNGNILRMNILAYTDSITGLPNRAVINHILDLAGSAGPDEGRGAMLFIDLDGFKRVNDTFGHDTGDELLRAVSTRIIEDGLGLDREELDSCTSAFGELAQTFPEQPVFARFAGDEFVVLLPGDYPEGALQDLGAAILRALDRPFTIFGNEIRIGASIGIATVDDGLEDPRELLIHADIAMYRAKERGRNCVAFFDQALKVQMDERAELEKDLRRALERDELSLSFQPKICASTNRLVGVEALARWHHPGRGAIPPDAFIPIAEQSGSMPLLSDIVLRLSASQARSWSRGGMRMPVAVNVSPAQFEAPDLVPKILGMIEMFDLDPSLLELEVTETLAMFDCAGTKRRLDALRKEGVRIAIDDFGTGYSNLSQLARLNFDAVKIDRSLIAGIGEDGKSEAMLDATINMAHALGHRVIAEGIESMAQMALLRSLGCDEFQGYYVARPMIAADLVAWHADRTANGLGRLQAGLAERVDVI